MPDAKDQPPPVSIQANNWFHDGWLFGVLGLPERCFEDLEATMSEGNLAAWREGYAMALETDSAFTSVIKKMADRGQLSIHVKEHP